MRGGVRQGRQNKLQLNVKKIRKKKERKWVLRILTDEKYAYYSFQKPKK